MVQRDALLGEVTAIITPLVEGNPNAAAHAAQIINLVKHHATQGGYAANRAGELQDAQLPGFLNDIQQYSLAQQPATTAVAPVV
ncbi:unnamed protein product [marine sediment metagenome]|uniref:Uncharacterized protein n=1 Tax=marine sediment metagenome TaxID=412755 RepID=X0W4P2_9ZZZZ